MSERTYLIVPAWSDLAGQCKIVSREGRHPQALLSWRENHTLWQESGIMNSQGKLVCLDNAALWEEMKADEPLSAGSVYYHDAQVQNHEDPELRAERPRA
jgi:hypothetical protein